MKKHSCRLFRLLFEALRQGVELLEHEGDPLVGLSRSHCIGPTRDAEKELHVPRGQSNDSAVATVGIQ
jgi:hypothetical protein